MRWEIFKTKRKLYATYNYVLSTYQSYRSIHRKTEVYAYTAYAIIGASL